MIKQLLLTLGLVAASASLQAQNYSTYLTTQRGFTEVTSTDDIVASPDNYYILCSAENTSLIVGVGAYEGKPGWASEESKALRYISANTDPVLNKSNFFTIEQNGGYIGLRNVVYNSDLFQTHDNAGYMYVNTFTDPSLDEWSYLTPTYQNGYWMFESGKYPISSGNWACGYLGPWNKTVAAGEPMALNRRNTEGDEAGHYRLFRISKTDFLTQWGLLWQAASANNKIDATFLITNPSFEIDKSTNDQLSVFGWTFEGYDGDGNALSLNDETKIRDYGMSNKDGQFLFNAYSWWAPTMNISQTASNIPSGEYELSAVVCTWEGRTVTFTGNETTITTNGVNDATGMPVSMDITIGNDQKLTISAGSTGQWWVDGHNGETQTFFKLDNVQLKCKGLYLNGVALPLPNDNTTLLLPDTWYYHNVAFGTDYQLIGNIDGMVYTTDGDKLISAITSETVSRQMTLPNGRIYFKTNRNDATLSLVPAREVNESDTFTVVALNVDGLPNKVFTINLNTDGPGQEGTALISQYLASKGYDFIGCSEDFNYHGTLMSSLNNNYSSGKVRATLSVEGLSLSMLLNGFRFDTDGLNLIWKNSTVTAANETWTQWNSMVETEGNQYVKKGYRHYDMTFQDNIFDVYILHMDAGNTNATASRESQWRQLADAINSADSSRPKLIIGDTNSRWTREDITANFMNRLNNNLTASDVWVEFYRGGVYPNTSMGDLTNQSDPTNYTNYEIVDKIIYINPTVPNTPQLVPVEFRIEQDYTYGNVQGTDNTTPLGDHKPVVVTFKLVTPGNPLPAEINLPVDGEDNSTIIANAQDVQANVTLSGRTLYKDNSWNTICLPFSMTEDQVNTQLAPTGLMKLTSTDYTASTHTLTMNFTDATEIQAGQPYIVKWNQGNNSVDPVFSGVTINNTLEPTTTTYADFIGTYTPVVLEAGDKSVLYLGATNTLYYPNADNITIGACHAYFTLKEDLYAGEPANQVNTFVLNFGDSVSGIENLQWSMHNGEWSMDNGQWYTINGVKLQGKPTERGLYIHGKTKVLIK